MSKHRRSRWAASALSSALLIFCSGVVAGAQDGGRKSGEMPCRAQPSLVGRCFRVRGRLSLYNGAPTVRLWRAGTRRVLGVSGSYSRDGYSSLPAEIESRLGWENEVWGDFLVCPFTRRRPREMQMVCIEEGRNIVARARR